MRPAPEIAAHQRGERAATHSGPVPRPRWVLRLWEDAQELLSVARVARRLFLTLLLVLAGCGGASAPVKTAATPDPVKDKAAIQKRVSAYVGHMLAGDGRQACAQFTAEYRLDADTRAKTAGLGSCADVFSLYGESVNGAMPSDFAEQASDPERIVVILHGSRAEAALKSPRGGLSIKRTTLQRVGSEWLIDGLGITRPRNR